MLKIFITQDKKMIDLLNNNSRIRSEAIYKANKKTVGTGLKN